MFFQTWKQRVRRLKIESYTLYLASQDPSVPWYAKVVIAGVIGYLLSPIDLIPDFIPVLGFIDDFIIVPLGILLAIKLIPEPVFQACRARAMETLNQNMPRKRFTGGVILTIWVALAVMGTVIVARWMI